MIWYRYGIYGSATLLFRVFCFYNLSFFLAYLQSVLHGTRQLYLKEARSIANTLRTKYPKMFEAVPGNDRLPANIVDGLQYVDSLVFKKRIEDEIGKRQDSVSILLTFLILLRC